MYGRERRAESQKDVDRDLSGYMYLHSQGIYRSDNGCKADLPITSVIGIL